jgi:hypothetical protein
MPARNGGAFGEQLTMTSSYTEPALRLPDVVRDRAQRAGEGHGRRRPSDLLETDSTAYTDPPATSIRALRMGARVGPKDLFVEVNSMKAPANTVYGSATHPFPLAVRTSMATAASSTRPVTITGPCPTTLTMVGDALSAPACTCTSTSGRSRTAAPATRSTTCSVRSPPPRRRRPGAGVSRTLQYFISTAPAAARTIANGDPRSLVQRQPGHETPCQFPDFPGTVGWKFDFQMLRDGEDAATGAPRFDPMRNGFFHYLLYAHARGSASSPFRA